MKNIKILTQTSYRFANRLALAALIGVFAFMAPASVYAQNAPPPENPQGGAIGMQGSISAPPPEQGATITVPANGSAFGETPITVSGICPDDEYIIKLFRNNIFSGSVQCEDGSYSIETDLFIGENELIARVFDALDQAGPDSNTINVTFEDDSAGVVDRPSLSSNFARRGANPGSTLFWPVILSGGQGPYAVSVDWGDGSSPDLFTQDIAGTFDIEHVYERPGVYNIVVKVTDANNNPAFLQLSGVANGPLSQTDVTGPDGGLEGGTGQTRILWQPAAILVLFIISTFWLGKRYELKRLRDKIERGERPF